MVCSCDVKGVMPQSEGHYLDMPPAPASFPKKGFILLCLNPLLCPLSTLRTEAIFSVIFKAGSARKWRKREGRDRAASFQKGLVKLPMVLAD